MGGYKTDGDDNHTHQVSVFYYQHGRKYQRSPDALKFWPAFKNIFINSIHDGKVKMLSKTADDTRCIEITNVLEDRIERHIEKLEEFLKRLTFKRETLDDLCGRKKSTMSPQDRKKQGKIGVLDKKIPQCCEECIEDTGLFKLKCILHII